VFYFILVAAIVAVLWFVFYIGEMKDVIDDVFIGEGDG
jgi:hypothetical protein